MLEGTVKFFDSTKGFGFIKPDNGGADIFVHDSGLKTAIRDNDRVSYEEGEGRRGPQAINVSLID